MILDYNYNKKKRVLNISYVKENGGKGVIGFNIDKFKTFYKTPQGRYTNWDGDKCDVKYTSSPHKFDIRNFITEMDPKYKQLLMGKVAPKLYTFDIEVEIEDENIFPEPSLAKYPISTISNANEMCNSIVFGTKPLTENEIKWIETQIQNYISAIPYFKKLNIPIPSFKYVHFTSEHDMLEYFLKNIVSKTPVLAGWNSILFDWQYIQNRVKNEYSDLSLAMASVTSSLSNKQYVDQRGNKVYLNMPDHTLILDMMDVIGEFDMVVMPIKESLSLDYIASETIKAHKIQYDGSLKDLYEKDYPRYVFYNAVDSILVQLIDRYFKTLQNIYTQSLYCMEKIGSCFSKIALTEALIWTDFYEHDLKVVPVRRDNIERGTLVGAYVRQPVPGKYRYVCCNDFASLYPSSIITCNISYENFLGHDFTDEEIERFKKDPNYFVSVNGNVYKNDKVYSFKRVQLKLKNNRNTGKYLAKQLDAQVLYDMEHLIKNGFVPERTYPENIINALKEIGFDIKNSNNLIPIYENGYDDFLSKLKFEITFLTSFEQAMKLLGNSMYGGSSHEACFWFNMDLANDITGEARNLIHMMEKHIPEYLNSEWDKMKDMHKLLNIKIDPIKLSEILKEKKDLAQIIYGDTDSVYADTAIKITDLSENQRVITIEDFYNENLDRDAGMTLTGHESVSTDSKILNWSEDRGLYYGKIKRIIRHKVTKPKWKLKTKSGKEIIVTNDHSMIVFRDGKKLEVKPRDILKTDKILVVNL